MGAIILYVIKCAVFLMIFFIFNKLTFKSETFHGFTRITWLAVIFLSLLLPLVYLPDLNSIFGSPAKNTGIISGGELQMEGIVANDIINPTFVQIIKLSSIIYFAGFMVTLIAFLFSYIKMIYFITRRRKAGFPETIQWDYIDDFENCKTLTECRNAELIICEDGISPFSWLKYVIISQKDLQENGREILLHELTHIKQKHSLDILATDILIIFQWFNPASWLLKHSLQQVHEYIADEGVIKAGVNAKKYQLLLIKKAVGQRLYSMANSFDHSKLKNRITMMLKRKSNKWAYAKCLYALPVAFLAMSAFAYPGISSKTEEISNVKFIKNPAVLQKSITGTPSVAKVLNSVPSNFKGLIFVNGKEYKNALSELPSDKIESINVSKDTSKIQLSTSDKKSIIITSVKTTSAIPARQNDDVIPFAIVEVKPKFQGGDQNTFTKWVYNHLKYPEDAKKLGKHGRVVVKFIVDEEGNVTNVKAIRKTYKSLNEEAINVIKASPKWTPGMSKGKKTKVSFTFPVIFQMREK
ncbi:MAG: M56 family metallopeptidase [Bacteroidales bacterium]|jgi:TonB family protein|nr:M56 family metallopeptidase [Bacteroidales bacterium]